MIGEPEFRTTGARLDWFSSVAMMTISRDGPSFLPDASLAFRLQAWREYREIPTQGSLEKASGVAHGVVMRIETGQVNDPRLSTLLKLAKVLGIMVSELVGK